MTVVAAIHLLAILWLGIVSQDLSRARARRIRIEAQLTGRFEEAIERFAHERRMIVVRGVAAIALVIAGAALSAAGVY